MTAAEIDARLRAAIRTLIAIPDPDARYLAGVRAHWPATNDSMADMWVLALEPVLVDVGPTDAGDRFEARGFEAARLERHRPTPREIDDMIPALMWLKWLRVRDRLLLWRVATGWTWWRLADRHRADEATVEGWYWQAIERVRARLIDAGAG